MSSLEALLSLDAGADPRDAIELIVARALFGAGQWSSPRRSDGIASYRIVERGPTRIRVCGKIWEIDQTPHLFWLDVEHHAAPACSTWTLYFDIDATLASTRRARQALEAILLPGDVSWRVTLTGDE